MKYICILLVVGSCVCGFGAEDKELARRVQVAVTYASKTLKNSQASLRERSDAFNSVSENDHIGSAVYLLSYLKKTTKGIKYNYLISQAQRKNALIMFDLLELEKALSKFRDDRIVETLALNLRKMPEVGRLTLLQALKATPGGTLDLEYLRLLKGRKTDIKEKVIAIEAVGERKLKEGLLMLQTLCLDKKQPFGVRCAAIRSLAKIPDLDSIEVLLQCYTEKGRIAAEARNALRSLTGNQMPPGTKGLNWWKEVKEGFEPPDDPVLYENSELKDQPICEFYGIPIVGKRFMFIMDRSGSMREDDKIDGVKNELIRIAESFSGETWFNIMFFNEGTSLWYQRKPYIKKADQKAGSSLNSFLITITPDGGTITERAIHETLVKLNPVANYETVFLLSDGLPNNDPFFLQYATFHLNRYLKARINTVFISEKGMAGISASSDSMVGNTLDPTLTAVQLMRNIAEMNDGVSINITPDQAGRN